MPILFLTLGTLPFLLPLWTQTTFREVYRFEERQIAVDNALIRLGRADRRLLRVFTQARRQLEMLESLHHAAHACARVPSPASAQCAAQDRLLELQVRTLAAGIDAALRRGWAANALLASELSLRGAQLTREPLPPYRREPCPVCGLASRWREVTGISARRSGLEWRAAGVLPVSGRVELEERERWDYRMFAK